MKKNNDKHVVDYIFETSWEVCNRVGGIYTVLSTRAASMQKLILDHVVFFGPDLGEQSNTYFVEDTTIFSDWKRPIGVRIGRWNIPGQPIAILLDFSFIRPERNTIFAWAWEKYGVQSHAAYGDYDDSCLFGYAAGTIMESLYKHLIQGKESLRFVAHANEWQTAFTIFYLREHCPAIGTLFTTHATSIGRSIAGNGKPLYDYFHGYHGDQMAQELNMVSKHSAEKKAAQYCDCFTTVSDLTALECEQLLDRKVDIVTPNGFEPDFVPKGATFTKQRKLARLALASVASTILNKTVANTDLFVCTAGRLEWKNKGIDAYLDSLHALDKQMEEKQCTKHITAFVMIPYLDKSSYSLRHVDVVFVPYYLCGNDPLFKMTYYDLLIGMDLTVYPSYYEPWGYTPLESIAFHVPTITTNLSGFGQWANSMGANKIKCGVSVIHRTDSNYFVVIDQIANVIYEYLMTSSEEQSTSRKAAANLAKKAEWKHFFDHYIQAYRIALQNCISR